MNLKDPAQFEATFQTHAPYVRAVARRLLRDDSAVEEIVQDVFLQAWLQADRFDPLRGDLRAWLTVLTRSRALDRMRRQATRKTADRTHALEHAPPAQHDPSGLAELTEGVSRVRNAWPSLAPLTRQMLELAYDEHLSQRDIAGRTQETLGVVKSRLRQGLQALKLHATTGGPAAAARAAESEWALTTTDLDDARRAVTLPSLQQLQVMVVDDDPATCEVLGTLLARAGASPIVRRSTADACQSLLESWPDVLLSDITMPGQDGYSLLTQVQTLAARSCRWLPAIAFTARATEWERTRALNAGFQMYMSKPVHPIAVLAAVKEVAGRRRPTGAD